MQALGALEYGDHEQALDLWNEILTMDPLFPDNQHVEDRTRTPQSDLVQLHEAMTSYLNDSELRLLCLSMGVDYEQLPGEELGRKTLELIDYSRRHGRMPDLVDQFCRTRPNASVQVRSVRSRLARPSDKP